MQFITSGLDIIKQNIVYLKRVLNNGPGRLSNNINKDHKRFSKIYQIFNLFPFFVNWYQILAIILPFKNINVRTEPAETLEYYINKILSCLDVLFKINRPVLLGPIITLNLTKTLFELITGVNISAQGLSLLEFL